MSWALTFTPAKGEAVGDYAAAWTPAGPDEPEAFTLRGSVNLGFGATRTDFISKAKATLAERQKALADQVNKYGPFVTADEAELNKAA